MDASGGVVVAGMGGSAAGARLALAALGPRLRRPFAIADDYALPGWVGPDTLVLCSSYSGTTEETLSAYDDAVARGAPRLVATTGGPLAERARHDGVPVIPVPGGFQPRAAVGYSLVAALEAAALAGAAPSLREEVEGAAALVAQLAPEWGPDGPEDGEAKTVARRLHGTVPVIAGAEVAAAAAYRWKCQINENAGQPAFASSLPELDHNEIVGWTPDGDGERFAAVFLTDADQHPRQRERAELTAKLIAPSASAVIEVETEGETRVERLLWAVMLGDLVSFQLAARNGVDPGPIELLERLKDELGRP
jgi:glucose/mannose-6-phosphate isomerase